MRSRLPGARGDRGFTLVELLIAVTLMGIVTAALGSTLTFMMKQTAATQTRLEVSSDAQLAAAYFAEDVASTGVRVTTPPFDPLQSVETNASATGGLYPCGSAALPRAVVRLARDEVTGGASEVRTRVIVSYVVVPTATERQLHRVVCRGSSTSPTIDQVVAHNVSAVTDPVLSCSSSCTAASPPKRVSMALTLAHPDDPTPVTVILTGQRRQT